MIGMMSLSVAVASAMPAVEVCLRSNGEPVSPTHVFRTGDRFSMSVTPPLDGYLYVVNVGPDCSKRLLFPYGSTLARDGGPAHRVRRGVPIHVPQQDGIWFTEPSGLERVFMVWSPRRLAAADKALEIAWREAGCDIGQPPTDPAAEPRPWLRIVPGVKGIKGMVAGPRPEGEPCEHYVGSTTSEAWIIVMPLNHKPAL